MMKHWNIRKRMVLLALLPAAAIAALLGIYFIDVRMRDLEQSLQERGLAVARQLAPASEYGLFSGNREVLQALVDATLKEPDVKAVTLTSADGGIFVRSGEPGSPPAPFAVPRETFAAQASGQAVWFSVPVYLSLVPLEDFAHPRQEAAPGAGPSPRRMLGVVTVELSRASTIAKKNTLILHGILITLLGLGATTLLAFWMSSGLARPIQKLSAAVRDIGLGKLSTRVPEDSGGELLTLEHGVNSMAEAIAYAHETLEHRVAEATAKLTHQANHDPLTGLVNRARFEVRLQDAMRSAHQHGREHVLCYIDLDKFKVINDTCGHFAGDELLRQIATLFRSGVRDRDTLGRLGGDEFGMLLENCAVEQACHVAENLRRCVADFRFTWQERIFAVSLSIGLIAINRERHDFQKIMRQADAACYLAKNKGRNCIHVYQPPEGEAENIEESEASSGAAISSALRENRFVLCYQPIVALDLPPQRPPHVEILTRMRGADHQLIYPGAFIPAAERHNLMTDIDRWVVQSVFGSFHRFISNGASGKIEKCSINLSAASLETPDFLPFLKEQFAACAVPPRGICFEITESAAIGHLSAAQKFIEEVKRLGCGLSLDDFGSGFSSFGHLKELEVDYIKIDGRFLRDIATNRVNLATVEAIHRIAQAMGVSSIAKSVESRGIVEQMRTLGVDYAQGNGIQPPRLLEDGISLPERD